MSIVCCLGALLPFLEGRAENGDQFLEIGKPLFSEAINWLDKIKALHVTYDVLTTNQGMEDRYETRDVIIDYEKLIYILKIVEFKDADHKEPLSFRIISWNGKTHTSWVGTLDPSYQSGGGMPTLSQASSGFAHITTQEGDGDPLLWAFTGLGPSYRPISKILLAALPEAVFGRARKGISISSPAFEVVVTSEGLPSGIKLLAIDSEEKPCVIRHYSFSEYQKDPSTGFPFPQHLDIRRFKTSELAPASTYSIKTLGSAVLDVNVEKAIEAFALPVGCRVQDDIKNMEYVVTDGPVGSIKALTEQLDGLRKTPDR